MRRESASSSSPMPSTACAIASLTVLTGMNPPVKRCVVRLELRGSVAREAGRLNRGDVGAAARDASRRLDAHEVEHRAVGRVVLASLWRLHAERARRAGRLRRRRHRAAGDHGEKPEQSEGAGDHTEYVWPRVTCSVTPISSLKSAKGMYRSGSAASPSRRSRRKDWTARTATNSVSTGSRITA